LPFSKHIASPSHHIGPAGEHDQAERHRAQSTPLAIRELANGSARVTMGDVDTSPRDAGELEAGISADGNTLVFSGTMTRGSSLGLQDIWIATRAHRPDQH